MSNSHWILLEDTNNIAIRDTYCMISPDPITHAKRIHITLQDKYDYASFGISLTVEECKSLAENLLSRI